MGFFVVFSRKKLIVIGYIIELKNDMTMEQEMQTLKEKIEKKRATFFNTDNLTETQVFKLTPREEEYVKALDWVLGQINMITM